MQDAMRRREKRSATPSPNLEMPNPDLETMLKTHLTIAVRMLRRPLGYTAINIVGLAVGMAACGAAHRVCA